MEAVLSPNKALQLIQKPLSGFRPTELDR